MRVLFVLKGKLMESEMYGRKRPIGKGLKAYLGEDYQYYRQLLETVPEHGEITISQWAGINDKNPTPFIEQRTSSLFQMIYQVALSHDEIEWGTQLNTVKRGSNFNKEQDDSHYWKPS